MSPDRAFTAYLFLLIVGFDWRQGVTLRTLWEKYREKFLRKQEKACLWQISRILG